MSHTEDEFYTIKDIAAKLKVCTNTVRALVKSKEIPALKVGHQWRITADDLNTFIDQRKQSHDGSKKVVPLTGPKHASQGIFGDDADHDDLFA
jgi:excisionase family DNA binding protein|tara:strand:- start:152 stop:430 length:279 start_codon:yes stop_codon:yes gene_type:complete